MTKERLEEWIDDLRKYNAIYLADIEEKREKITQLKKDCEGYKRLAMKYAAELKAVRG